MDTRKGEPILAIDDNALPELDARRLFNVPATVPTFIFTGLPAFPKQGDRALMSDASGPTWLAVVSGGGASTFAPIFFDGTHWRFG